MDFFLQLHNIDDPRKRKEYGIDEIVTGGIAMFMFKEDSRNAFNNDRECALFKENYRRLFSMELPHMDTVKDVMCVLKEDALEDVKADMVSSLIRKKIFNNFRYQGRYTIVIDGSGTVSFDYPHCNCCLTKTSKNQITTYFHNILEAKLVTPSGFSISIASEWINNEGKTEFDKQDCERKAFQRLADKIKKYFPRLPIILIADGLYPYQGFFQTCKKNGWDYILTLKDNSLRTLQQDIQLEKRLTSHKQTYQVYHQTKTIKQTSDYHWLKGLEYKGYDLNYVECTEKQAYVKTGKEEINKFVHITNLEVNEKTYQRISACGRLRQKIENEGFNQQKNHGYNLEHKFIRNSFLGMKNFYQCLQISHIINQLAEHTKEFASLMECGNHNSVKHLWKRLLSFMLEKLVFIEELSSLTNKRFQLRLC